MGGVLRDDDKTVSKTDIKIKDNGKDKGHCIRSYDSIGSLQRVIWLNDCHISTAWDKWDSEMTQSLCNYQRLTLVNMTVRVMAIVMGKIAFSWLSLVAFGFLPKHHGWALILTVTNPCFGTLGKDFTYIFRNWYVLTNSANVSTFRPYWRSTYVADIKQKSLMSTLLTTR